MKFELAKESLRETDEAWLVVDKDNWPEEHLNQLFHWSQSQENHGLAVSNPQFEFWLLLHFEDAFGIRTASECTQRLYEHLPEFNKSIDHRKITIEMILSAIARAKKRDKPLCEDWPKEEGVTTVYRLIERIVGDVEIT
jgi:hypothetical protein